MKFHSFLYYFFPKRCPACKNLISPDSFFCDSCILEYLSLIRSDSIKELDFPAYFVADYSGCVKKAIHKFKISGVTSIRHDIARDMSRLYFSKMAALNPDVMIPAPSHKSSYFKNGYSHTDLLAREISKIINVRYCRGALVKTVKTPPQHTLNLKERTQNLSGAFSVPDSKLPLIKDKNVLLIDDISTTGSTLKECEKTLKNHGAASVSALLFASTENIFNGNI